MGAWIVWEARNLGMSKWHIARMSGNVGVDFLLGLIPWVGAIPDFFFRSNTRNLRIVKRWLDKHHPGTTDDRGRGGGAAGALGSYREAAIESEQTGTVPAFAAALAGSKSRPMSAAGADWVRRPTET